VAVKSEAKQASTVIFRTRDLLVRQRTQIINALRGHLDVWMRDLLGGSDHDEGFGQDAWV